MTETYKYAELGGRLSQRDTKVEHKNASDTITTINQFSQTVAYEPEFARVKTIGYPTCSAVGCSATNGLTSVGQLFDKGALETVTSFATLAYDPTGIVTEVKRTTPSTSIDTYVADSGLARPESITFAGLSNCTPPSLPQIQSAASVCASSPSNAASVVVPPGGLTYAWSITGGTITSGASSSEILFTAGTSGTVTLTVTATNACGSEASLPRSVSITALPAVPQIQAPVSVCPSSAGNTASVSNPVGGITYTWSISGPGTITSATTGSSITFTAGTSGTFSLTVTATNGCGSTPSSPRGVPITGPAALLQGSTEIDRGQSATLSVTLTGTAPWNVRWLDGFEQIGVASSPVTRPVSPLVTTTYLLESVTDASCTGAVSGNATVTVYPLSPSSIIATSNNSSVAVSWTASSGAVSYAVERATSRLGSFQTVGTTGALTLNDNVPASATPVTYVYRVRAIDEIGTWSRASTAPMDFATTASVLFAEAVTAGWEIKGSHLSELQRAVDALRIASGLSTLFGSAPSLTGSPIAVSDFTSVINALNGARSVWGLPTFVYSGVPGPSPGEIVYAAHVTQLRDGVR